MLLSEDNVGDGVGLGGTVSKKTDTRGPFLLVSQIMAQRTKVNPWEFVVTKPCIVSFVMSNFRTLALAHHLI